MGRSQLPLVFGASPEATAEGAAAMWTLCIGYPVMAVVRFCSSYFCAVGEPVFSGILAYGEPLGTQSLMLLVLPLFLGLTGVWVAWPAAVALTAVAFVLMQWTPLKKLHPIVYIAAAAVVGAVFAF